MGTALLQQSRWNEAGEQFAQARLLAIGTGDLRAIATVDLDQGIVDEGHGRFELAEQNFQRAATDFQALGEMNRLAHARSYLIDVQIENFALSRAQDTGRLISASLPNERNPAHRLMDEIALSQLSLAQGFNAEGRRRLVEAEHDADALVDSPFYKYYVETQIASMAVDEGDPEQAERMATRAIGWFLAHGDVQKNLGMARLALSGAFRLRKQPGQSAKVLAELRAQPEGQRSGDLSLQLDVETAKVDAAAQQDEDAAKLFASAYERACKESTPFTQVQVASAYLEFLLQQHRVSEAESVAGFLSRWTSESFDAALWVARYTASIGHRDAALAMFQQAHKLAGDRWDERIEAEWTELQGDLPKLSAVKP